ncbi:MAG: hypothetical protein AAF449_09485 [Myxococcota bacterium]
MTPSARLDALPSIYRAWSAAHLFHFLGNTSGLRFDGEIGIAPWLSIVEWSLILCAALALWRPSNRYIVALAGLQLVNVVFEEPGMGSHVMVLLAGNLTILWGALLQTVSPQRDAASAVPQVGLKIAAAVYLLSAFQKLNSDFLDPEVSCANRLIGSIAPVLSDAPWLGWAAVLSEALMGVGILIAPLRSVTVLFAMAFHWFMALDIGAHFYDFSMVMIALLTCAFSQKPERPDERLVSNTSASLAIYIIGTVACLFLFASQTVAARIMATTGSFILWLFFGSSIVISAAKIVWESGEISDAIKRFGSKRSALSEEGMGPGIFLIAAPALVFLLLNGMSPYLEIKYAFSFNMYSNLRAEQGRSNHLILRKTWPLTSHLSEYAKIEDSSDSKLHRYRDENYGIPLLQLRDYLYSHPKETVTYRHRGVLYEQKSSGDGPHFSEPSSWLQSRLHVFRAIDLNDKRRCYDSWLAAH